MFLSTLIFGLDALTLQDKHLKRIAADYIHFQRRIVCIKASFCSRISPQEVYGRGGEPRTPSAPLNKAQVKMISQVFQASPDDSLHHVVFIPALKDRVRATGGRRGGKTLIGSRPQLTGISGIFGTDALSILAFSAQTEYTRKYQVSETFASRRSNARRLARTTLAKKNLKSLS